MKITTFNPMILTRDPESVIALFESLGFEKRHQKDGIEGQDITNVRMKNAEGDHIDIVKVGFIEQDSTVIRMNVDDFDEAYEFLTARGFKNFQGEGHFINAASAKGAIMVSPSGFAIDLAQHIKD